MTEYELHRPSFSGTTTNDWEFPTEQDFDTDDLPTVADRFLLSASGFEHPEKFDDLALPVVNTRGFLSLNGLFAARHGPYSVERVEGLDEETKAEVETLIDDLGTENFDAFKDVTVTPAEWERATGGSLGLPNPLGGIDAVLGSAQPFYSSRSAVVGLVFLALGTVALERYHDRP